MKHALVLCAFWGALIVLGRLADIAWRDLGTIIALGIFLGVITKVFRDLQNQQADEE